MFAMQEEAKQTLASLQAQAAADAAKKAEAEEGAGKAGAAVGDGLEDEVSDITDYRRGRI